MTSREKVKNILTRKGAEGVFWTGHPNDKTIPIYAEKWNIEPTREAIYAYLGDDCRWFMADGAYKHPEGLKPFIPNTGAARDESVDINIFAGAKTVSDLDRFQWPDVKYLDFSGVYAEIDKFQDKMIFTGM